MRKTLIITLLLFLGAHQGYAATITARVSATVLEPVNISFHDQRHDYASIEASDRVVINSANDIHYQLSHRPSDVCLLANTPSAQDISRDSKLTLASCETYTVNFN